MRLHVGTSGYNYPEWRGTFYPEKLPAKDMFGHYSARFTTVEINYTFYRMPTVKTTEGWRSQAPDGFTYALKAPRRITHDKRLQGADDLVPMFVESARVLGAHLGPLLFQLPPHFKADLGRLQAFLSLLPRDLRVAFEFRHDSWLSDAVFDTLRQHGAALCIADFGDKTTPVVASARHGYFRLRDEGYGVDDLARWADAVASRAGDWDEVFIYFKHEEEGKGPEFARLFVEQAQTRGLTLA
jgi:uncharacterized protein YecE (DUF72 family)